MAAPDYNIGEPAPAALPSFVPAAGTVCSSRASGLVRGFPLWGGWVSRAPVLWMAMHKARLRMGVSAPAKAFPGWERAGARAAGLRSGSVGMMGSRSARQCRGHGWGPAAMPCSRSEPAPPHFAEGDQKLIAGFAARGRSGMSAGSFPPPASPAGALCLGCRQRPLAAARKVSCCCPCRSALDPARHPLPAPSHPSK